ncbi:MAG: alpha-mannosidase [Ruminococcaceae bacterium]|nr:alpha-mannosidase [Oscillospiraceae bacterium]
MRAAYLLQEENMKEVHLICNAHLDPIWQWEWEEGAAAALSTFRAAADLAEEFDYIFCHNEVTLYKYIEEYAPGLFKRIKDLIRRGKWHIMGGWYLQPDCNMPQGESFIRQIQVGHRYFMEKFGVNPTTAINFDAFGHTRGLVQIIKKCGQDSLILCRAGCDSIPAGQFWWEGFDGSRIKVNGVRQGYNTPLGHAAEAIQNKANAQPEDRICVLWGVGNHGGGPSRKDLADIDAMIAEGSMKILHSTPETFFASIDPAAVHDKSLRTVMPGCYTSMSQIKLKHAELENNLYMVEKLCSVAAMRGLIAYPEAELDEVVEDLLNAEFHDVLPGSSVRAGEENGIRLLDHGLLLLNRLRARAYFAMANAEPSAAEGEYPVLVLNPNPYEWETEIMCEFSLADQNWSDSDAYQPRVFDAEGNTVPAQVVKEESNLNLDWRKRIYFRAKLNPLSLTRFSVYMDLQPKKVKTYESGADVIVDLPAIGKHVEIDGKTGLMRSFRIDGREYIDSTKGGAFCPVFYKDNPDPWGMGHFQLTAMGADPVPFRLMEQPDGMFKGMQPIQVIEDGDVYTGVECFLQCENTRIRLEYDIYKHTDAVDVKVDVFLADNDRMLKLALPLAATGEYIGQTAFGTEPLYMDGRECVAQRFVAVRDDEKCIALLNRGTYGSSWKDGVLSMSLVRGVSYCAHPINDRPIIPTDRYVKKIDMGERNYCFRLTAAPEVSLERLAMEYNVPAYACNVFPLGEGEKFVPAELSISDRDVTLVTLKKQEGKNGYILRLLNNWSGEKEVKVSFCDTALSLHFGRYEVKTLLWDNGKMNEIPTLII